MPDAVMTDVTVLRRLCAGAVLTLPAYSPHRMLIIMCAAVRHTTSVLHL